MNISGNKMVKNVIRQRKNIHLSNFDYSQNGMYFVTICTKGRFGFFGEINEGKMFLNEWGKIVENNLLNIAKDFENIFLDRYIVMPNHAHLILEIINRGDVGVRFIEPVFNKPNKWGGFDKSNPYKNDELIGLDESSPYGKIKNNPMVLNRNTLGKIIRYFKAKTTKNIRDEKEHIDFSWQRSFYDRIIRNEIELNKIREYIIKNPEMWEDDENNPIQK